MQKLHKKDHINKQKRILPHNYEAEEALLATLLIDSEALANMHKVEADDFFNPSNAIIFDAIVSLVGKNTPVETITLIEELKNQGKLEDAGGVSYILKLPDIMPINSNFLHYCKIIKENSNLRKLIKASSNISDKAFCADENAFTFAESEIFSLCEKFDRSEIVLLKESVVEAISEIQLLQENPLYRRGVPTPFKLLNIKLGGWQKGDLVLVAARPGQGKTSIAMNFITHAALCNNRHGEVAKVEPYSCAVFSLEMPAIQLAKRMLCSVAKVSLEKANNGKLNDSEWKSLRKAKTLIDKAKIWVDDSSVITAEEILSKCRRLKRQHGLDLVMIDYLQLMTTGRAVENRQLEVSQITRTLKIAAKELNVPIILLSQLSREVEKRQDKKPQMSDLRESGAIEQDADIILFIYRKEEEQNGKVELLISKHRNGSTGSIEIRWSGETVSFMDVDYSYDMQSLQATAPPEKSSKEIFDNFEQSESDIENFNINEDLEQSSIDSENVKEIKNEELEQLNKKINLDDYGL